MINRNNLFLFYPHEQKCTLYSKVSSHLLAKVRTIHLHVLLKHCAILTCLYRLFFFLNSYQHSSGKDRVLEWQKQQKFSLLKLWKGINLSHLHRDIPQHCLMFERHLKKRKVKKLRESKREKLQIAWISFSLLKLLTIQQITIFPQT